MDNHTTSQPQPDADSSVAEAAISPDEAAATARLNRKARRALKRAAGEFSHPEAMKHVDQLDDAPVHTSPAAGNAAAAPATDLVTPGSNPDEVAVTLRAAPPATPSAAAAPAEAVVEPVREPAAEATDEPAVAPAPPAAPPKAVPDVAVAPAPVIKTAPEPAPARPATKTEAPPAQPVDPNAPPRFEDMQLRASTKAAVDGMGFDSATPIQAETIPLLLEGRDVIGQAQTGTGKTAAFGIPLVEAAADGRRAIVLTPTRELAQQVQRELQAIGKGSPADAICIIGGAPFRQQIDAIQRHPDAIIVATPGRVVDHLYRGSLRLDDRTVLVLDEADEMLSMGFADELDTIISALPKERQTVLFTATLAPAIESLAKRTLHNPVTVRTGRGAAPKVRQCFTYAAGRDRTAAIARIIEAEAPRATLLFGRTRARVEELVNELDGVRAEALHGGMNQPVREAVMQRFRDGKTRLLVATDVAARGLDVNDIDLVLHDEPAGDVDTYIHRIGRTGRAGRSGTSIVLLPPGRIGRLSAIRRAVGKIEQYELPDELGLQRIRAERLVGNLADVEAAPGAHHAFRIATQGGMSAEDVAIRALHLLTAPTIEVAEAAPATTTAIALKVGKMDHVNPGAIVGVLCNAGGLRAEDIGRIDVLDKMSVVEVPAAEAERVIAAIDRVQLSRRWLKPRAAEDWRFKATPRN